MAKNLYIFVIYEKHNQLRSFNKMSKKMQFSAETGKVLQLMIHSLYTNKDIFLRELISNSSDALDKLRYQAIEKPELMGNDSELKIRINFDENSKEISIFDNGIGMNEQDLIDNLGTIAASGTQKFMENLTGDRQKDAQLIGQFGVGFYSIFMVANEVEVLSKKAGDSKMWRWHSEGTDEFEIEECEQAEFERGTKITLKMKDEEISFVNEHRLRHIISIYSDHINFPIFLGGNEESVNRSSAVWTRNKSEVSQEQYEEFFHHIAHDPGKPWMILHNKNEGMIEYSNLLFIPENKPFDLFHPDRKSRVKLYVKRVFITDDAVEMIPAHMRFLRGVVDSSDLPLNISRETLQNNDIISRIKKSIAKRVISELKKRLQENVESYLKFWKNFGAVLKEGLCEGIEESRENLLEICMFRSAKKNELITLDQYLSEMPENQEEIYFISGDDAEKLANGPQIEAFLKKGLDVLIFTDNVDDFWVNVSGYFKGKTMKSVTRSGIDLSKFSPEAEKTEKEAEKTENIEKILNFAKSVLENHVKDVRKSSRLVDSPSCLTVDEGAMDIRMERFLIEQKQLNSSSAKILELNFDHPIVKKIINHLENNENSSEAKELVEILFDQACIIENEPLVSNAQFVKRLNKILEMV